MEKKTLDSSKIKILICCHKECELPQNPDGIFLPIQVGAALTDNHWGIQRDDQVNGETCDNISHKNKSYCELTAMYWAWKNIKKLYPDLEYIGLCHYRRYFIKRDKKIARKISFLFGYLKTIVKVVFGKDSGCNRYFFQTNGNITDKRLNIKNLISNIDFLCVEPMHFYDSSIYNYFKAMSIYYLDLVEEIIKNNFYEFLESYKKIISGSEISPANMLIMNVRYLDEYANFIFGVLDEHEKLVVERGLCKEPLVDGSYFRLSGYIAEILTYVFLLKKKSDKSKLKYTGSLFIK